VQRFEHPLFVVAEEEANVAGRGGAERGQPLEDALRIRAAVDVIAQEYQDVLLADLRQEAFEKIVERREITVDVADGDCRQTRPSRCRWGCGEYMSGTPRGHKSDVREVPPPVFYLGWQGVAVSLSAA
jgi:hypothetical protein